MGRGGAASAFSNGYSDRNNNAAPQTGYNNQGNYVPHNEEKTSVKVHAPPGGKSNFSLGGGFNDEPEKNSYSSKKRQMNAQNNSSGAASAL